MALRFSASSMADSKNWPFYLLIGAMILYATASLFPNPWAMTPRGDIGDLMPRELVLQQFDQPRYWRVDDRLGGIVVGVANGSKVDVQRWQPPWKAPIAEPMPADAPNAVLVDLAHHEAVSVWMDPASPTRDSRLVFIDRETGKSARPDISAGISASLSYDGAYAEQAFVQKGTRIISLADGTILATTPSIASGLGGHGAVWHPTENALAIGGYGALTIFAEPDWKPRSLTTAPRDFAEWEARVRVGDEETGYHPAENPHNVGFSSDGEWLLGVMDRGLRVYRWQDVKNADAALPKPVYAFESDLFSTGGFFETKLRMTYAAVFDVTNGIIWWTGLEGKLSAFEIKADRAHLVTQLPAGVCFTRLELIGSGQAMAVEATVGLLSNDGRSRLMVLDYAKLRATLTEKTAID